MSQYATIKAIIDQVVTTNGQQEITGALLNEVLKAMVDSLGSDYQYGGVVVPSSYVGTPDQNVFYIALQAGTYTSFGNTKVPNGVTIFMWDGSWTCKILFAGDGGVFDITAYNNNTKYPDIAAALGASGANVPELFRKGGMSVKFVLSSENKYVQFRCMSQSFTTDVTQWQGVDDALNAGSNNLAKSGSVALSRADNYREKETISYIKRDGVYFTVAGTEISNAAYCIIRVDFPIPYFNNYYFDNVYNYGTEPNNVGFIRYKDANGVVIKTIANSVRSGFIGYRVEKIYGAASFEICGPIANWGNNFNVYQGNVSIIPSKFSAIDQEFVNLKSNFAPQYILAKETLSYTVEHGKFFNSSGADVASADYSVLTMNFPSTYYNNYYIDSNSYFNVGLLRYLDASNNVIKTITTNVRRGVKGYRVEKISGAAKFQICGLTSQIGNEVVIYSGVLGSPVSQEEVRQEVSAEFNAEIIKPENAQLTFFGSVSDIEQTVENGKYFTPSGEDVANAIFSIITAEFPQNYYDEYYIDSQSYGGSVGFLRYLDASNNVIMTMYSNVRGGVKGYRVKKIGNAAKFQICGVTDTIGNGTRIYNGTKINKTEEIQGGIQRKKYLGKKLFAIGDSHTQQRSKWLPYVLEQLGCIGDEAAQQTVYNAGATMENPLYYDYLLQNASKLIEISQGGGFTPDIILIEQCHYNNVTDPIDAVSNTVVLPEKLLRVEQTFNSKTDAISYWANNYSTILSGFSSEAHKRTILEIPYGALGRNLKFEATKTITAGSVKLSIDGTEFTTQVTAGMTIQQVVNAMSIWKYGDTTDWSNNDEVDSDTLHLTYTGQEEHPTVSIVFTDVDNCGVSLVSNTEVGRIQYLLRYFYPTTTTGWSDETKWLHLNDGNDSLGYGLVKGCIEMLQKGLPNAKIIIWSVQGLLLTQNSYVTNGCFDNQAFLNDPNYKKFEVDARTVMFGVAKQYALKTIDVAGMCGITPLNMFEGNFYNENDLHPKPAGYQRWAETLVENI